MNNKVLIVDDERAIVDILKYNLEKNGMTAICAYDGGEGLRLARESDPDVILLDVMLPVMDGFEVCRTLRAEGNNVPIIMITAREEETDKVFGLELGADDYITKPFSMREVVARVRTNMRRAVAMAPQSAPEPSGDQLRAKDLTIDKARHAVFLKSRRSFYRITHAVNEPHPCDSVLHFEFRRLFGDKLWLGGHDGASACRLRQFVRVSLFLCACHLREHQLLHELFDECGLARSDGTDNADIDVSARPRCNVLIYAE